MPEIPIPFTQGSNCPLALPPLAHHAPVCAGIVAEYNPFHKGHAWMIQQLRRSGVHTVVCVMSGAMVQRGEAAILPTPIRAQAALAGGVDLVLRLPAGVATASAESFAAGAVGLLSALGCVDLLAFGAETPQLNKLKALTDFLLCDEFIPVLKEQLAAGSSFAAARAEAAEHFLPGAKSLLCSPNNILAIEYLKALHHSVPKALRTRMPEEIRSLAAPHLYGNAAQPDALFPLPQPVAVPRAGAGHDGPPAEGFASASWLRGQLQQDNITAWQPWVPSECIPIYEKAAATGAVLDSTRFETILLGRLRGMSAAEIARCPGAGEGLENRLAEAAQKATTPEELYALAKTKRFAHSRIRRLALSAALHIHTPPPVIPPFAQILAANSRGLALLRKAKKTTMIPLSTSLAKLAQTSAEAKTCVGLESVVEDLYALCLQRPQAGGSAFTHPAFLQVQKPVLP